MFFATTTVSILSGVTADDGFGDSADNSTVAASAIPASILEQGRQSTDRATGMPRVVRYIACRLPAGTAVTEDNRILDERTGSAYFIESVSQLSSFVGTNDLKLDLRKIN
jgi:hypothetical protein